MYEDRTRKYDPKAPEKYPIHDAPYSFSQTTLQHAWTTTSITLTGYKQQYMIMRLKLKGNNKPLLIVCYECHWQGSLFTVDFKLCDWCIHSSEWLALSEEEHWLSRERLRWSWWISKITMKIWIWSLFNKLTIKIKPKKTKFKFLQFYPSRNVITWDWHSNNQTA